jgi:hypothetical protein
MRLSAIALLCMWAAMPARTVQSAQRSMGDLSGVWWSKTFDPAYLPMDGKPIPFTPMGRKTYEEALLEIKSGKREDLATKRCIPQGVPRILSAPYPFLIVQRQDIVAVIHEITHAAQLVFMHQAQLPLDDVNESFMGHSVGRWDGATLVIDTIGLKDNWMDGTGLPHSDKLHVVERLRKVNGGRQLENLITIEDPDLFTRAWTARRVYELRTDVGLMEYVCGEPNRDVSAVHTVKRGGH